MDFKRFKEIILRNREYESEVKEAVKSFKDQVAFDGDISKIVKEIGRRFDTFVLELPMRDSDFGACFFETGYSKYLLLNSNQPKHKMYFSFCHDIYHILNGTSNYINEKREVHLNQEYFTNENENKANLFAANILMPEIEFEKMYRLFKTDDAKLEHVIVKLMNYFNAPFIAVIIRFYELRLLDETSMIKDMLDYDAKKIENLFDEVWLDKEILNHSMKDEILYLKEVLNVESDRLVENQVMKRYNADMIIENIMKFYESIRVNKNEE